MWTSIEKRLLNSLLCSHPRLSERLHILYANVTCCRLQRGSKPTLCSIPASARAVYAPREKPNRHILSPFSSTKQCRREKEREKQQQS